MRAFSFEAQECVRLHERHLRLFESVSLEALNVSLRCFLDFTLEPAFEIMQREMKL